MSQFSDIDPAAISNRVDASAGGVCEIFLASAAGTPLTRVGEALAVAERGIEGDRYFDGVGSFSRWPGEGRAVTLIAAESIAAIRGEHGIDLSEGRSRRNVVTRGVNLESLNGRKFRIGTAVFRGVRLCAPCGYLERLVGPGTFEAMRGRGGLRADVLTTGTFQIGDEIVPL